MSSSKEWHIEGMSESGGSMSTRSRDRVDAVSRYGEKPKTTMPDTLTYAAGEGSTGVSDARCASRDEPPAVSAIRSTDTPSACDDLSRLSGILPSRHSAPANVRWKLFLGSERDNDRPAEIEQAAESRGIRRVKWKVAAELRNASLRSPSPVWCVPFSLRVARPGGRAGWRPDEGSRDARRPGLLLRQGISRQKNGQQHTVRHERDGRGASQLSVRHAAARHEPFERPIGHRPLVDRGPSADLRADGPIIDVSHRTAEVLGFVQWGRTRCASKCWRGAVVSRPPLPLPSVEAGSPAATRWRRRGARR